MSNHEEPASTPTALTADAVAGMCAPMNDDHADSILAYVHHYARLTEATAARMMQLDASGIDVHVVMPSGGRSVRIAFDHAVRDTDDARQTLIAMARTAASSS